MTRLGGFRVTLWLSGLLWSQISGPWKDSLDRYESQGRYDQVVRLVRQLREGFYGDSMQIGWLYYTEGSAMYRLGRPHEAAYLLDMALRYITSISALQAEILIFSAAAAVDQGQLSKADSALKRALNLAESLRDTPLYQKILTALAYHAYYAEDFHAMLDYSKKLISLLDQGKARPSDLYYAAAVNCGLALSALGRPQEAEGYLREAYAKAAQFPPPPYIRARLIENLGLTYNEMDRQEEALQLYTEAEALYHEIGDSLALAHLYNNIGKLLIEIGDKRAARKILEKAAYYAEQHAGKMSMILPNIYLNLADITLRDGEVEKASYLLQQAKSFLNLVGPSTLAAYVYFVEGDILRRQNRLQAAREAYTTALSLTDSLLETGNALYIHLLSRLGLIAIQEGQFTEAEHLLSEAGYRYERYVHTSVSPYSPEVLSYWAVLSALLERQNQLRASDSLAVETLRRALTRMQLFLPILCMGRKPDAMRDYLYPYYQDVQRRAGLRSDSALIVASLWANYVIEVLENFPSHDSLLKIKPAIRTLMQRWKESFYSYHKAEREGNIARAESLSAQAQAYQEELWKMLGFPSLKEADFLGALRQKLAKKTALVKVIPYSVEGDPTHIVYVVYRHRRRLIIHKQRVHVKDNPAQVWEKLTKNILSTLKGRVNRLQLFSASEIPETVSQLLKSSAIEPITHTGESVWSWLASRR
ncbi:MAG: tetratricopeptide repeat protein [Bacteroidia bacterium]|nr:tetratricopeptide repeat protein [Bacteroidia bacterium]